MGSRRRYSRFLALHTAELQIALTNTIMMSLMIACYVTTAPYQRYSFRGSILVALVYYSVYRSVNDPSEALITGAGHGIGKELAIGYASLGATVVCWDINEENNNETMNDIKKKGNDSVYAYRCNVADEKEVFRVAKKVKEEVGDVTILINNAGIAFVKSFLNLSPDEITRGINVNMTAHYWTLKAFLSSMIEKNHGHIVSISSIAALFNICYGTVYCPTKFAVSAIMDSLSDELYVLSNGRSSIKFTTVYPFFVRTGFVKNIYFRFPWLIRDLLPQEMALSIINAQRQNYKNQIIPPYWSSILKIKRYV
ncbi:Short-chain dehydrogenase/reductase family 16C member 6 [Atta colombica]|uniref:Short-chain dehydrogenase/reductase 3 n=1 Tax=Atta colombica TaxID=520822 RepID=A0A151HYZ2_9HYME|nr:Short-chain dehydrogenase/reductase family 16C member 6 [Atta colombica]